MRKINILATLFFVAVLLFSCNNSSTKPDETNVKTDSSKVKTDSSTTVVENKKVADSSKAPLQVSAEFVSFSLGDASHFIFKDKSGKTWDFSDDQDSTYKFAVELPKNKSNETNQGWGSDPKLVGKWFDITYILKDEPQYTGGPMAKVEVITAVKPR